jgi:anthranilate/para-aminobenzoate synthase component I
LTDEEFKHNVALAKSIVSEEMYSNWSYLVGLPKASKETSSMYRALRSINPSLFILFDYGDFKIFGSSEAQIIVKTVRPKSILSQEL